MKETLRDVQLALLGEVVMSNELDALGNSLFNNQIPDDWNKYGFKCLKPLASWFEDLLGRVEFIKKWINEGLPIVFYINKFVFPQAFITGTKQNFARKHKVAIDQLTFDFIINDKLSEEEIALLKDRPEDGCFIYGMQMEAARWDYERHFLNSSLPKVLYTPFPLVQLLPVKDR